MTRETKEQKFYKALQDVFIGAKIEGTGGFVNLMKSNQITTVRLRIFSKRILKRL